MADDPRKLSDIDQQLSSVANYRNLLDEVDNLLQATNQGWDGINSAQQKTLQNGRNILQQGRDLLNKEKLTEAQFNRRLELTQQLMGFDNDLASLASKRGELEQEIAYYNSKGHESKALEAEVLKEMVTIEEGRIRTQDLTNDLQSKSRELLGGSADSMVDIAVGAYEAYKELGGWGAVLYVAFKVLTSFGEKMDQIGESFGATVLQNRELRGELLKSSQGAARLGQGLQEVIQIQQTLTDNFAIGFSEARKLNLEVMDMAQALGLTNDEGAQLIGTFKNLVGLSGEQAVALTKNIHLLAHANNVAPQQIMRDVAASSESIAGFTKETGENIAKAAIQARKFGQSLNDAAQSARGLLDYQETLRKSLEASVIIGKQINTEKLMELSLAGNLVGFQQEQKRLLDEIGFAELDSILHKEKAAEALGLSVDQAQKMVNLQKEATTLAGELAGQPGFDELVGTEGISTLTKMKGLFSSIGATLVNGLGPALNALLVVILKIVQALDFALELTGINTIARLIGGQGFSYNPGARFKEGMGINQKVSEFADGGIVTAPTQGIVGEAGPEAVVPLDKFMSEFRTLKSEMQGVKEAIQSLNLTTKITNRDLNVILTPSKT